MKKLFIIQKYVVASSIKEALKIEKNTKPDECWLDDEWKRAHKPIADKQLAGFKGKK